MQGRRSRPTLLSAIGRRAHPHRLIAKSSRMPGMNGGARGAGEGTVRSRRHQAIPTGSPVKPTEQVRHIWATQRLPVCRRWDPPYDPTRARTDRRSAKQPRSAMKTSPLLDSGFRSLGGKSRLHSSSSREISRLRAISTTPTSAGGTANAGPFSDSRYARHGHHHEGDHCDHARHELSLPHQVPLPTDRLNLDLSCVERSRGGADRRLSRCHRRCWRIARP